MKYLNSIKDIAVTVLCILAFFLILSFIAQGNIPLVQQNNEVIILSPLEAYLRGSIKIDEDNSISNWRNEKNVIHWRFKCIEKGTYQVTLVHGKTSKDFQIIFNNDRQKLSQALTKNSTETEIGKLHLSNGIHEVALYAADIPKKSKLPAIFSIILTKIN